MRIKKYFSLVKFSHTIFALPFAIVTFFLAYFRYPLPTQDIIKLFSLMIACMVFARNSAMGFNRYLDRGIDFKNPRTAKIREIPKGTITPRAAFIFVVVNAALFIITTFFINSLCFMLSPVALVVILGYSYTKRFTALCHFVLGIGIALAPIGSYLTVANTFNLLPLLFSSLVFFWVAGFDIIYALQDEEFDRENNLYAIPSLLGERKALIFSRLAHVSVSIHLIVIGIYGNFRWIYWIGASLFFFFLFRQHMIVRSSKKDKINFAFFTLNGVASILYALFIIIDILL